MKPKPVILVTISNHFDPTWRRCFRKRFMSGGNRYASYAEIEAAYIIENLKLCRNEPAYRFNVESALVARTFLERNPVWRAEFLRRAREGRLAVSGAGENIIDTNLVLGESIVRNYLLGNLWMDEELGQVTDVANRNDGFGNSAQLPQILRGCGFVAVDNCTYVRLTEPVWKGLDGSTILNGDLGTGISGIGKGGYGCDKLPPCPACRGRGCAQCHDRGFVALRYADPVLNEDKLRQLGIGFVSFGGEELLPGGNILRLAR